MRYLFLLFLLVGCSTQKVSEKQNPSYATSQFCGGFIIVRDQGSVLKDEDISSAKKDCENSGRCLGSIFAFEDGRVDHTCRNKEFFKFKED